MPSSIMSIETYTSSALAAATSLPASDEPPGAANGECKLLGPFAILIQAALGGLALLSLVFKRWRERPQRPVKIWAFDASKQVVGSILLHLANLLMSEISSGGLTKMPSAEQDGYRANPCSFYLLNLAIDTTIGIPVLIVLLRVLTYLFSKTGLANPAESIKSGNYGHPPKSLWWLKQCLIYFLGLLGMKLCVWLFFQLCPWIVHVGDWALKWTEGDEHVQVFFVMLFFPLVMNAMQYYIIDGFIKNKKPAEHEPLPGEDEGSEREELAHPPHSSNAWDASFDSEDEVDGLKRGSQDERTRLVKPAPTVKVDDGAQVYDPEVDGESASPASGSSSRQVENGGDRRARDKRTSQ